MAVRTRSFDSRTAVSGSPTMSKEGSPAAESTSTAMMSPSTPIVVPPNDLANNRNPPNLYDSPAVPLFRSRRQAACKTLTSQTRRAGDGFPSAPLRRRPQ